ncbi:CbrC family protein [Xanthomonas campestris pv. cannae]|nr:CbrC family protein [Xanthomonas campestris pv. cannae]
MEAAGQGGPVFRTQLPEFLHHPNAYALCFAQEGGVCDCCGETRAWGYQGLYCAGVAPQSLCPGCIATVACLFRCLQCGQHCPYVDMG